MSKGTLDRIHIRDLRLRCIVGINPEERRKKQDVEIDITLYADLRAAGRTDAMEDTVDYRAIKLKVVEEVEASSFFLLEGLAEHVADVCLCDPRVVRVRVRIEKPGALRFARTVGVEIIRDRAEHG
jgi:dihydroneopterin aldolase/D-erythro-7,8-dihydroneopterin triphosphate epimerase